MVDIFSSDAFSTTSLAAALKKVPYKPSRLGPGGLGLFDEKPIPTLSVYVEEQDGQLSMISASPRGDSGDFIANTGRRARPFSALHFRRNAKVMADEVQGVRMFGSENELLSVEAVVADKLALLQGMHEVTWEFLRMGALTGVVLDPNDASTVLLDIYAAFGVSQQTYNFELSDDGLDVRAASEAVVDLIDEELGGSSYDRVHAFCGGAFYDALISQTFVQDVLKAQQGARMLDDLRSGFTIGPITFERAKRWKVKTPAGTTVDMINTDHAYAFPIGAATENGPMFIGRFAPQPFLDTVNRLNPPLVVKTVVDPANQFVNLLGISCPIYLNTRPRAVIKITKS